jgi:hypothetical protein
MDPIQALQNMYNFILNKAPTVETERVDILKHAQAIHAALEAGATATKERDALLAEKEGPNVIPGPGSEKIKKAPANG